MAKVASPASTRCAGVVLYSSACRVGSVAARAHMARAGVPAAHARAACKASSGEGAGPVPLHRSARTAVRRHKTDIQARSRVQPLGLGHVEAGVVGVGRPAAVSVPGLVTGGSGGGGGGGGEAPAACP